MQPPTTSRTKFIVLSIVMLLGIAFGILYLLRTPPTPTPEIPLPPEIEVIPEEVEITIPEEVPPITQAYYTYTLVTTEPAQELIDLVGEEHLATVLRINRINSRFLKTGDTVTLPTVFSSDLHEYSPFPKEIPEAQEIQKLILISQRMQAFGIYESGILIKWGPTSTGKASTPTPNGLFFTNWKGKSVISSIDDGWLLKWNFNLDNRRGVSLHEYAMPGYPASHACIRLFGSDAKWIYEWADQWILSGNTQLAKGTPTIIFGEYDYTQDAPWKQLPTNPEMLHIPEEEIAELITTHHLAIMDAFTQRAELVNPTTPAISLTENTSESSHQYIRR